jgi:hypothetical protein
VNVLIDGPAEVEIFGDRVTMRCTSDGRRLTLTVRLEDALITQHRLASAVEAVMARRASDGRTVVAFPSLSPPPPPRTERA